MVGLRPKILFALIVAGTASAGNQAFAQERDRFGLFTNCQPIYVAVEGLARQEKKIGLTEEMLEIAVEAALLGARIPISDDGPLLHYLYLNVHVVGRSFDVGLFFKKKFVDTFSGERGFASSWSSGSTGTHGGDPEYILSWIRPHLDKFVVEYLRANLAECAF